MTSSYEEVPAPQELHTKICKKIAQLTKVIYALNSRVEEQDALMAEMREQHEKELEGVTLQAKHKVDKLSQHVRVVREKEAEVSKLQQHMEEMREQNAKLQQQFEQQQKTTQLNEQQLRNGYENKFLDLQNKLLERKRDYTEVLEQINRRGNDQSKQHEISLEELKRNLKVEEEKRITELKRKYDAQIQATKDKTEGEVDSMKKNHEQSLEELQKKVRAMEVEGMRKENECESKLEKMKQFYEQELKTRRQNETKVEDWEAERNRITMQFQLQEKEMSSRIRYLQGKVDEDAKSRDDLQVIVKRLQTSQEDNNEKIAGLEDTVVKKEEQFRQVEERLGVSEKKREDLVEKLNAAMMKNESNLLIEEAYGDVSRNLDNYKKKFSQLQHTHGQLESKLKISEEENSRLQELLSHEADGKTVETQKLKGLEARLKSARNRNEVVIEENKTLKAKTTTLEGECVGLKNKVNEMELMVQKKVERIDRLEDEHRKEKEVHIVVEQRMCAEKRNMEEEQSKLLAEKNGVEKEKTMLREEMNGIAKEKEKMQEEMLSKDVQIQRVRGELDEVQRKCEQLTQQLDDGAQQRNALTTRLEERGTKMTSEVEKLKQNMATMTAGFDADKRELVRQHEADKLKLEATLNAQLDKLQNDWEQKLREAHAEFDMLHKHHKTTADRELKDMEDKCQTQVLHVERTKDKEISSLHSQLQQFKRSVETLGNDLNMSQHQYETQMLEKVEQFKAEKEELVRCHEKEVIALKSLRKKEAEEAARAVHMEKSEAVDVLQQQHDAAMLELRQEHAEAMKILRKQLREEKEESVAAVRTQVCQEKEKMEEVVRVQTEERIKAIVREYEGRVEEGRSALEQHNHLRQEEFLLHSRKIAQLTTNVEEEKQLTSSLYTKVSEMEDKTKYLNDELTTKGEEILKIRRETNSKLRQEMEQLEKSHRMEKESMRSEYLNQRSQDHVEWEENKSHLVHQITSLQMMLEGLEEKFRQRPSREEDIEKLKELTQKLFERELECERVNEERKHYRLELVNREENFNKVFSASPNVGYINPIEISKRKSSSRKMK